MLLGSVPGRASTLPTALCLPPVFEQGRRLHEAGAPSAYWLALLLRQHEVCWRTPAVAGEARVFLSGNSAVYGYPLPIRDTLSARLNDHFAATEVPAHVYDLSFVTTYQLKDALIIRESLAYHPAIIIYAMTLAELVHVAPAGFSIDDEFFRANGAALRRFADERPPGLGEPLDDYRSLVEAAAPGVRLRQVGALVHAGLRQHAKALRAHFFPDRADATLAPEGHRQRTYDCNKTKGEAAAWFRDWQQWNMLAYLQQVQSTTGATVLIVNWPLAHEPVEDCYDVRFPAALVQQYNQWLQEQTALRGLHYVDLHDLLPPEEYLDSLHVSAGGHRAIAARLAPVVDALVAERAQR